MVVDKVRPATTDWVVVAESLAGMAIIMFWADTSVASARGYPLVRARTVSYSPEEHNQLAVGQ